MNLRGTGLLATAVATAVAAAATSAGAQGFGLFDKVEISAPKPRQAQIYVRALSGKDESIQLLALQELAELAGQPATAKAARRIADIAVSKRASLEMREAALWVIVEMPARVRGPITARLWPLIKTLQPGKVMGLAAVALAKQGASPGKLTAYLLVHLGTPDDFTRAAAASALAELGDKALPTLVARLRAAGTREAVDLAEVFYEMGPKARRALPELRAELAKRKEDRVRRALIGAIAAVEEKPPALDVLIAELKKKPGYLTLSSIFRTLEKHGRKASAAVPPAIAVLSEDNALITLDVLAKIATPRQHQQVANAATRYLASKESSTRWAASQLLATLGAPGRGAIEQALRDKRSEVRHAGLSGVAKLPDKGRGMFKRICRILLGDRDDEVRAAAASVMAGLGPRAAPALIRAFERDKSDGVRWNAVSALGSVGGARAVDPLLRALSDPNEGVRKSAAHALGQIGPPAARAAMPLLEAHADNRVYDTSDAIAKLGVGALPTLRRALTDKRKEVRKEAAMALGDMGAKAAPAVPDLAVALASESDGYARGWAAFALGRIGPAASAAMPELESALTDEKDWVRNAAARAIGRIGTPSAAALRVLIALVEDPNDASEEVIEALVKARARDALPALRKAVTEARLSMARNEAIDALVTLGDKSAAARKILRKALGDDSAYVRSRAAKALLALGEERDIMPAMQVLRRAPEDKRKENAESMRQLNRMLGDPP